MSEKEIVKSFFEAVKSNNLKSVIEHVEKLNVDVNSIDEDNYGRTALHVAALEFNYDLMKCLLRNTKQILTRLMISVTCPCIFVLLMAIWKQFGIWWIKEAIVGLYLKQGTEK